MAKPVSQIHKIGHLILALRDLGYRSTGVVGGVF